MRFKFLELLQNKELVIEGSLNSISSNTNVEYTNVTLSKSDRINSNIGNTKFEKNPKTRGFIAWLVSDPTDARLRYRR